MCSLAFADVHLILSARPKEQLSARGGAAGGGEGRDFYSRCELLDPIIPAGFQFPICWLFMDAAAPCFFLRACSSSLCRLIHSIQHETPATRSRDSQRNARREPCPGLAWPLSGPAPVQFRGQPRLFVDLVIASSYCSFAHGCYGATCYACLFASILLLFLALNLMARSHNPCHASCLSL